MASSCFAVSAAPSSDSSTFIIASLCGSLLRTDPSFFKASHCDHHRTAAQRANSCCLLPDSRKLRKSWSPIDCSKTPPSYGADTQNEGGEQTPDSPAARKSSQESDLVRKAFEKAAAYKNRRNDVSRSDEGTLSMAEGKRNPDLLSPTVRTPASPELPSRVPLSSEPDVSSSSGSDVTRNTRTTPAAAATQLELSKDDLSQRATVHDDSTTLSGIWKGEPTQNKQESEIVFALTEGRDAGKAEAEEDSSNSLEVEILTRDGVIRRKVLRPDQTFSKSNELKRSGVSSLDFLGLDFADKKPAGKPAAGLAAGLEAPPPGILPEIEIITRDGSKLDEVNTGGLYKPKVATWGIFERPANISQTFGGGRVIIPGEQLETEEQKKGREARTKQLLDAYHKKIGLDVDLKIKADCIKALKQGNDLLEKGELQNALSFFEKVMYQMPYQSELHGCAALQWSVCLDSMNRFQEARSMYEKLATHPNVGVRKRAKELLFGFQAMDTLKVSVSKWDAAMYQKYFDAFAADGYNTLYKASAEEKDGGKMREQTFLYLGVLMFPLVLVFVLVFLKST